MVKLTINDQKVTTCRKVLPSCRLPGKWAFEIPHLCYLKDINDIGACRVCIVELEGMEKLVTALQYTVQKREW